MRYIILFHVNTKSEVVETNGEVFGEVEVTTTNVYVIPTTKLQPQHNPLHFADKDNVRAIIEAGTYKKYCHSTERLPYITNVDVAIVTTLND